MINRSFSMSKKNRKSNTSSVPVSANPAWDAEYQVISKDLIRVIILNIVYLVGLLAVYYTNQQQHYLEQMFARLFHW
ncbi:MAG: hypothetical protein JNK33_01340 [Candidatus Doudnabacteria bacterium]|nr:hypothetical protein [Candidatus Doudnabacteria bacterium]